MRTKKFDHAVGLLQAAIKHGLAKPWMYEALALAQEAAGVEPKEIRRTLLSAADVITEDPHSQYRVATMLVRHDLNDAAIRIYRDVARQSPFSHEPYVQTLQIAGAIGDVDSVKWAAGHLLARSWPVNHHEFQKQARAQVFKMELTLKSEGKSQEAESLRKAIDTLDNRDLVIRLSWRGEADLDLVVKEPLGTVCSMMNRITPAGGVLVRDSMGADAGGKENPAEEYICARGLSGPYIVNVRRVWGKPYGGKAKLEIAYFEGTKKKRTESHYVTIGADPLTITLDNGRRTGLLSVPQVSRSPRESSGKLPIQQAWEVAAAESGGKYAGPQQLFQSVAFNPTITQIFNGAGMVAQAVVSADRRYVRLSIQPFFNNIVGTRRFSVSGAAGGRGFGF